MEKYSKFIIENDYLIMAKVTYHKELATDIKSVKGGGWVKYDGQDQSFTFSGESHDFGKARLDDIKKCVADKKVFTDINQYRNISDKFIFKYDTGTEQIVLNP